MRVLIAAAACHPHQGSEGYVGWSSVNAIARRHDIHVITNVDSREGIEAAMAGHPLRERMSFSYVGELPKWHPNRMIARFQSWFLYKKWITAAAACARDLCAGGHFDVAHHVTLATWRMGTPLAGLGLPLVWGPIGGGEQFPLRFFSMLSPVAAGFEILRMISGWVSQKSRALRETVRRSNVVLPNNIETAQLMRHLGVDKKRIEILSQSFLYPEKFARLRCEVPKDSPEKCLRVFAGGNLEGRKGVAIVLRALSMLEAEGVPFEFVYGGKGPELNHLLALSKKLHLPPARVRLGVNLAGEAYFNALKASHVYLLPSLREGAPVTMIEAMAASCVPIVGNCGGAAMLIDNQCGRLIAITTPVEMTLAIAHELRSLQRSPDLLAELSAKALEKISMFASEDHYLERISACYQLAVEDFGDQGSGVRS